VGTGEFQDALRRLVTDAEYREAVLTDERRLLTDFELTPGELGLLQAVWEAVGGRSERASAAARGLLLCHWAACCCCDFR